ncbi:gamma-glutamylcyclotransferase [uncultured Methanobrevibacter sp.]|uniref:gamma-glutamylcyclotransferase family protein n=1 Tax=uncultured Methanobrevibacter sp. TaxID=253161 RepID=UPI0025EC7BE4|nr:gamma-glutamylcyclotransferase family protein [uncultured Methanobrevibacter sp.]
MKMIKLEKQDEPRFDEFSRMLCELEEFLDEEADFTDKEWSENLKTILDFQDEDGSFKLFCSFNIPSDARVDFCYIPTYLATASLMKAYLSEPESFTEKEITALSDGLKMSTARNLRGHGYEGLKGQIEAVNIFMKAGLNEFMDLHHGLCPEFSEMIDKIVSAFADMEAQGKFTGSWGESYEDEIRAINQYFRQRKVFVYGTLMKGETNHDFLQNATFLDKTVIEGYDMYKVGWYPAIIDGEGLAIGEVYSVPVEDMASIDSLEGEGSLYEKRCVRITVNGVPDFAFVYVYLDDCSDLSKIPSWREHVWYVSYGSNMLGERFMRYIKGGSYEGSAYREPCKDMSPPAAVRTLEIPFDMYFGNLSSWGGGVSFLDTTEKGKSLGVAYLITRQQFEHVSCEENGGRCPGGGEWYEDIIDLEPIDGIEVKTITNNDLRPYNEPSQRYLDTLFEGIKENWPQMSDNDIWSYLGNCMR